MSSTARSQDEDMLMALAGALVQHPRATLKDLAGAVGVSKATLYRFCSTREQLTTWLVTFCQERYLRIILECELETAPLRDALSKLIDRLIERPEFFTFIGLHWNLGIHSGQDIYEQWAKADRRIDAFFERGQREKVFRSDIPALALADSFPYVMTSYCEAARRGRLAPVELKSAIEKFFMHGASA